MVVLEHTLGILLHPEREWKAIRNEKYSFLQVFTSHVPILALIPVVCSFIGAAVVGWELGGERVRLTYGSAFSLCLLTYFALIAGVYALGEFINWMSRVYGVKDNEDRRHYEGTALAVYVTVPVFLMGFVHLYPNIYLNAGALVIAGLYSVYLIYEGIPILMNISKEQAFLYASSVVTVSLVLAVIVRVGSVVIWGMGIGPVYID